MYYKRKNYDKAIKRSSELTLKSAEYKAGFFSHQNDNQTGFDVRAIYRQEFGEPVDGSEGWRNFCFAREDKQGIIAYEQYKSLNLDIFQIELNVLLKKYDVTLSFGCGCCGGGLECGNLEFEYEGC